MQDKNICFVTFIEASSAASFYNRGITEGLVLKGKRLKFGWGKPTPLPHTVASAVLHLGASRNVYIGALDSSISEDKLRQDFVEFGEIELVNMVPEKNIGFVNFTDIMSAVKTVELMRQQLQQEGVMTVGSGDYTKYKINFGKDRCGNPPRPPRHAMAHPNGMGSNGMSMIPQIPSPPVTSPTDSAYDSPLYAHAQINTGAKLYSSGNGTAGLYPSSTTPPVNYTMLSNGLYDSPPSSSMTGGVSPLSNTSVRHLTPPMSPVPPLDTSSCLHARTHSANSNNSEIMMHQSHHHHRIMSSLGLETDDFDMDLSRLVLEDKALI